MFVIRKKLDAREGAPPRTRVNPDTGVVETTNDDGATWVEDPRSDPRQNPAYMQPPPTATDVRCAAAAGMVENVRKVVAAALAFGTAGGLATVLLPLLLIPGIGWMYLVMLIFASVILILGGGAIAAEMTEDVYDRLLCIFVENIDEDGRVSWAQLETIHDTISTEYSGTLIPDFIGALFQYQREVGVTNAGVAYADPLAECACGWCELVDFRTGAHGWAAGEADFGVQGELAAEGWIPTLAVGGSGYAARDFLAYYDFGGLVVDSFEAFIVNVVEGDFSTAPIGAYRADIYNDGALVATQDDPTGDHLVFAETLTLGVVSVFLRAGYCSVCGDPGGYGEFQQFVIRGQGEAPGIGEPC